MRASKLLAERDCARGSQGLDWRASTERALLVILATTQAAVEALAAEAGTGPARRIKAILDGEGGTAP